VTPDDKPQTLSWSVHRARETPAKTWLAGVFIFVFLTFVAVFFEPVLALLGAVVLFIALNAYFLPVTVTFHDRGVTIDKRLFKAEYQWSQFRRWVRTSGGIVLSPFSRKSYLDNFRGVHLMLPADDSAIVAYLERRFAPPPPDERLKLDDAEEVVERSRDREIK
jgi:fatty acid desaturase